MRERQREPVQISPLGSWGGRELVSHNWRYRAPPEEELKTRRDCFPAKNITKIAISEKMALTSLKMVEYIAG